MSSDYLLKKYGIDKKQLKKAAKKIDMKGLEEVTENLRKTAEKYSPLVWFVSFGDFKRDIENGEYDIAYSSDVFKGIMSLCKKDNISILKRGTHLVRARIIDDENDLFESKKGIHIKNNNIYGYDWTNSKEPPIGVSSEGRANIKHSSYFYCSEDGNTAASEVKPSINEYVSLATFTTKRNLKLLELSNNGCKSMSQEESYYMIELMRCFSTPVRNAEGYKFTQFISDEIRKCGIDGIQYKSYLTNSYNYVIFNCSMNTLKFVTSGIVQLYSQQLNFIDFSSEELLSTKCDTEISDKDLLQKKRILFTIMEQRKRIKNDILEVNNNG